MSKTPEIRIKVPAVDRLLLLTEAQLKVWLWYKRREGVDKKAFGKAQTIADATRLEPGTVRNARSWLTRNGWLLRKEVPGKLPMFLSVIPELHQGTPEVSSSNDSGVISELHPVSFEDEPQVVSIEVATMKDSVLRTEERKEESSLASLVRQGADAPSVEKQEKDSSGVSPERREQPQEQLISFRVSDLESTWTNRTGYRFSEEDKFAADALIRFHGYAVTAAVLHNTLYDRPKSKKMRWNNFQVFARNFDLNYEAYRSWCVDNHREIAYKFDVIVPYTPENYANLKEYQDWFKTKCKRGEWTISGKEQTDLGFTDKDRLAAICLAVEDGMVVTKDEFIALMRGASGVAPLAKPAAAMEEA